MAIDSLHNGTPEWSGAQVLDSNAWRRFPFRPNFIRCGGEHGNLMSTVGKASGGINHYAFKTADVEMGRQYRDSPWNHPWNNPHRRQPE